ncbi:MAG: hypothetical protein K1X82_08925 [Bacteroidia bacterium]|nr:hypothetical protein [Bacteroidia bacterium]
MTKSWYFSLLLVGFLSVSATSFGQKKSKNEELPPAYTSADEFLMLNSWDKDGSPMVVNGNGHQIDYHENGKKKGEGNYANGKKEGFWIFFHTNGKKESEGNFKNGNPSGKWKYYYPKGKLRTEIEYKEN